MGKSKSEKGNFVFRRIRGRIVRIKVKGPRGHKNRERAKGGALVAGGLALSAGVGFKGGKLLKRAALEGETIKRFTSSAQLAFDFNHGGTAQGKKVQQILLKGAARRLPKFKASLGLSKAALFLSGSVVAGAIVGEGISKIGGTLSKKKLNTFEEITSDVAGVGVSALSAKSFSSGAGNKLIRKILSKGKL